MSEEPLILEGELSLRQDDGTMLEINPGGGGWILVPALIEHFGFKPEAGLGRSEDYKTPGRYRITIERIEDE